MVEMSAHGRTYNENTSVKGRVRIGKQGGRPMLGRERCRQSEMIFDKDYARKAA